MQYEKTICDSVMQLMKTREMAVLGIDGLGGAGKSTLSETICRALEHSGFPTILLHMDDFIHPREIRYDSSYPEWQCYYELQWRYHYFLDVIENLKNSINRSYTIEFYDKEHDSYFQKQLSVREKTVIVAEGIFLQRKELRGIFDYLVYLDVPEDVRICRVLKRDTYIGNEQQILDKYEKRYFPAERHYCSEYHPDRSADLVITDFPERSSP